MTNAWGQFSSCCLSASTFVVVRAAAQQEWGLGFELFTAAHYGGLLSEALQHTITNITLANA
jgi:hypothetical protein